MPNRKPPSSGTRLAGIGFELAATVGGGCLLGYWIDRHYNVSPWGLIICAVIGILGGLYNVIRQSVRETFARPEQRPRKNGPGGREPNA